MKYSIKTFLLINLLICFALIAALTLFVNLYIGKHKIDSHLETQFIFFKPIVEPLWNDDKLEANKMLNKIQNNYTQFKLASQNRVFMPNIMIKQKITTLPWQIFVSDGNIINEPQFAITTDYNDHLELEQQIIKYSIWTLILSIPILGLLIWLILKNGLSSIKKITQAVKTRAPSYLQDVNLESTPAELTELIQELNNLFAKVRETFEREERFAADAAHELRTPLAALRAHVHVALNAATKEERDNALQKVNQGIERSTHVINQLLILNRATASKTKTPEMQPVSLKVEAENVIAELFQTAKKRNITLELIDEEEEQYLISGNAITVSILIKNLVDNAIRYINTDGKIQVVLEHIGKSIIVKVIDDGPGIPENMREQVFKRFVRLADSSIQGSGLGLNIVQQIAKQHNATIALATPPSGKGLEVDVTFSEF